MKSQYDVVILGAGHNGLVAASYLGREGLSVRLLEKNDYIGGATTSQKVFPDYNARLSRYSYLVSLFPEKIIRDLGLNLELRRRATASFTPYVTDGQHNGLLLSNVSKETSQQSMFELTGNHTEYEQMKKFYNLSRVFAAQVWDTMLEPIVAKEDFRRRFDVDDISREAWRSLAEELFFFQAEDGIRDLTVTGVQTCALPISTAARRPTTQSGRSPILFRRRTSINPSLSCGPAATISCRSTTSIGSTTPVGTGRDRKSVV